MPPCHPLYHAELSPDKPAWFFDEQVTTYEALGVSLLQGAQMLRKLGLKTGDGIAVLAENHPDSLALYWAAQTAGLYYTPISVQFQAAEVQHILNDCDAKLLVTSETQALKTAAAPQAQRLSIENWLQDISSESQTLIDDACEGAEMLYSSGTTGHPKGVRAAHPGGTLGSVPELFARRLNLHEIDHTAVYLSTAPLYHSAPLRYNAMMHRSGTTSVIMDRFEAQKSLALIEQYRVTHSQWVPTMFVRLLRLPEEDRRACDLSSHRFAIHAAAPCPIEIKHQMLDWWGPILFEYYSGTEGNGQTAISPLEWLEHEGSVGKPILGKLHITNDAGEELKHGETGSVYFSDGPEFEYYKDPEKTAAAYNHQGWSTLGDIGYVDEEGYLYLTDRASHMIISGGVNIYPREIEDVLVTHPSVQDVAVFGIPHKEFGEEVKAAVQLVEGEAVAAETLIEFCRARLAHLKCPRSIDFHVELPRHQTGKLYKEVLKTPYWPEKH
ncbi:MAG: AMP-binding protein [Gammaproteobacteria bacterium]|nr:AMP-binding protein [Gammaproteobacteria bacterium]